MDYNCPTRYEGSLKAEIIRFAKGSSGGSGIVGVMALGLGGVGKTCALRGLAKDPGVKEMFPDRILFVQLSNDSVLSDIFMGIADCVEGTGGTRLGRTIQGLGSVEEACAKARPWFDKCKVLLLVDDIWEVNGITTHELRNLERMFSDASLLVFTSRSRGFIGGIDKYIHFKEREAHGELARFLLLNHANSRGYKELSSRNIEAMESILEV